MLRISLIVVIILVVGLLAYAATRPDDFRIERSARIKAPPEKIFDLIHDFKRWNAWSPYEKLDPALKRTLSGEDSGRGAIYAWEGNRKAGQGRMEITESTPSSRIAIDLDFIKPFAASNVAEFTFVPDGEFTTVTWVMSGPSPFISKLIGVFVNIDKMVGKDFEVGLAQLKAIAES